MLKHFGIGQGVATKKIGKMLDDTYYDDFHNVLYERMLRNKIKKDIYDYIIYDIWVNPQYFREKLYQS